MASNDEYQQRQLFEKNESWMKFALWRAEEDYKEQAIEAYNHINYRNYKEEDLEREILTIKTK